MSKTVGSWKMRKKIRMFYAERSNVYILIAIQEYTSTTLMYPHSFLILAPLHLWDIPGYF